MKLSIIILNYNTKDLLTQAVKSINTKFTHEIIVVDNASTDGSVTAIKRNFPKVKLLELSQNYGFAAGNNAGLKIATGQYLFLLNSDTLIIKDSLDRCLKYLDSHPQVGILTPKLLLTDGAIDLACHRGFPTPSNALSYFLKLEQLFPSSHFFAGYHQTWKDFNTTHQVDVVSGASMFIRRQVLDQIGFLDERFFMYAEDIDFCYRAKQHGWQVVYFPKAGVVHLKGSSGTNSVDLATKSNTRQQFYLTMKQYFHKHHSLQYPKPVLKLIDFSIDLISKIKK